MIGFGDIASKIGGALNNPTVKGTLKTVGNVGNSLGSSTAFGAAPQQPGQPAGDSGFGDVRPMTPPPQTGNVGDIFRRFAQNRMAAKTATNVGQGPGAGAGSPDVAVGLGAIR